MSKLTVLCLCLFAVPGWSWQSDKPSPFEIKSRAKRRPQNTRPDDPSSNTGVATFFKASTNSRDRTASGEPVDDDALTAVHMTLPLGSQVRVVNLANNKSVVVRVTDRAAFPPGRIISVNYRAAKELGFLGSGTARVRLEPADKR